MFTKKRILYTAFFLLVVLILNYALNVSTGVNILLFAIFVIGIFVFDIKKINTNVKK